MAYNYKLTVNNVGDDEQIVVQTVCREITVGEDEGVGFPTVEWMYKTPSATDYARKVAGAKQTFTKPGYWRPGELVAYVKTAQGSASFNVFED